MPRLYRLVKHNPAQPEDFLSHEAEGIPLPDDARPELVESWKAVSAYDGEEPVRRLAERAEKRGQDRGRYIAVLEIPEGGRIHSVPTGKRGHYDLHGTPADLVACVVEVRPL